MNNSTQLTKLIKIKDDTYDRLSERGKKNDTYDDIVRKLLDLTEPKKK
jgi:predicted CopG family antitoxin